MGSEKFTQRKPINLKAVIAEGVELSAGQLQAWLENNGYTEPVRWGDNKEFRAFCHRNRITPKLEEKGFIRNVNATCYRIGQCFKVYDKGDTCYAQLCALPDSSVYMTVLGEGTYWGSSVIKPQEITHITESEFKTMTAKMGTVTPVTFEQAARALVLKLNLRTH